MRKRAGTLILGIAVWLAASQVQAFITALYPLKDVLAGGQFIFMAKVEKIDPDKPALILGVGEKLKGNPAFDKMPMNLVGDSEGQKAKHTQQLLKRLAADMSVVVFVNQRGKRYEAFVFTNGTWFQAIGHIDKEDSAKIRWAFTHCEPYLRRTFKGSTAELREVVIDGLSGKKAPPEPDPKAPPGLGPEVKTEDRGSKIEDRGSSALGLRSSALGLRSSALGLRSSILNPRSSTSHSRSSIFDPQSSPSCWAVIPTFVIMGPLALLAALFPAMFGGLAFFMRRWMVLCPSPAWPARSIGCITGFRDKFEIIGGELRRPSGSRLAFLVRLASGGRTHAISRPRPGPMQRRCNSSGTIWSPYASSA